jgi:hypothetical protein
MCSDDNNGFRRVAFYVDLHAHAAKRGTFLYGIRFNEEEFILFYVFD